MLGGNITDIKFVGAGKCSVADPAEATFRNNAEPTTRGL